MTPFRIENSVTFVADFTADESEILSGLADNLVQLLRDADDLDPAMQRLLPDAYSDDDAASEEFRRFTGDDLVDAKIANAELIAASFVQQGENAEGSPGETRITLSLADAHGWMRALTDLRITLAVRLGITDDSDTEDSAVNNPVVHSLYDWLGFVQETLVNAVVQLQQGFASR